MRLGRVSNFVFKAGFERSRPCPERGSAAPIRADAAPPVPHADRRKPAFGIVFFADWSMRDSIVLTCPAGKMALSSEAISEPAIKNHSAR